MFELDKYKNIYMIGIGGISMSSIAKYFCLMGFNVSGSDRDMSEVINDLRKENIKVNIGHDKKNITQDIDLIIYTAAIHEDNEELIRAKELNIKIISRAEVLGLIMQRYKYSVAVSGSHGKTTVTAMISQILIEAKKNPTVFLGGVLNFLEEKNFVMGKSDYFVIEACEYCDSFLNFEPFIGVINNIDWDHVDYFKDFNMLKESFKKFALNVKKDGAVVINNKNKDLVKDINREKNFFGEDEKDVWHAENIIWNDDQCAKFSAVKNNLVIKDIKLKVPGYYNVLNVLSAIGVAEKLKIDFDVIKKALENFCGVERRFEFKGIYNGAKIFDDYAHHPNELKELVLMAKKIKHNSLYLVFQSHTYSRTKKFFNEFAEILSKCENVILVDIYSAREKNIFGVSIKDLVNEINKLDGNAIYFESFDKAREFLKKNIGKDDLVLTVGAGDVYKIGEKILSEK